MKHIYDLAIIGAGPGGYVAAIHAAKAGLSTALIERDDVGGTCLNRGCIPTKSFAATAEKFASLGRGRVSSLGDFGIDGIDISGAHINMARVVERKDKIVAGLRSGIHQLLGANKIDYIKGTARFVSPVELSVTDNTGHDSLITSHCFIIATGSTWRNLKGLVPDGRTVVTSDHLLDGKDMPRKLLIVGGGVIGSEFASIMNAFGVDVTIIEMMDRLLPMEDAFISRTLASSFKRRGIKIFTGVTVAEVGSLDADKILVSVGRAPCIEGLDLAAAGVKTEKGFIVTNEHLETSVPNIYAIGDVAIVPGVSKPMLAHVASYEASVAVSNIGVAGFSLRDFVSVDYSIVPRPIFTHPEIGCVGATDEQLKAAGVKYNTGRFSFAGLPKAVCDGETEGALHLYTAGGRILGAHCIGVHATDICAEISLAMRNKLKPEDVIRTIHAHPTYSEAVVEALERIR